MQVHLNPEVLVWFLTANRKVKSLSLLQFTKNFGVYEAEIVE